MLKEGTIIETRTTENIRLMKTENKRKKEAGQHKKGLCICRMYVTYAFTTIYKSGSSVPNRGAISSTPEYMLSMSSFSLMLPFPPHYFLIAPSVTSLGVALPTLN